MKILIWMLFYKGEIHEDFLFNVLHEHVMKIAGMLLDINPIFVKGTDEMEEYMRTSDCYLEDGAKEMVSI